MQYKAKSIMIGRMKGPGTSEEYPYLVYIKLFDINDPHKTTHVPLKELDFSGKMKVEISGKDLIYLPRGNDIVINNLTSMSIVEAKDVISLKLK